MKKNEFPKGGLHKPVSMTETVYQPFQLERGECITCSEVSDEILIQTNQCIDCIEADKFYEETMKGL